MHRGILAALAAAGVVAACSSPSHHIARNATATSPTTTGGQSGQPVTLVPAQAADIEVRVTLKQTVVRRGQPMGVTVDVINTTHHPLKLNGCGSVPEVPLWLNQVSLNNQPAYTVSACSRVPAPQMTPGDHVTTGQVSTDYTFCGGPPSANSYDFPPCTALPFPKDLVELPAGRYRLVIGDVGGEYPVPPGDSVAAPAGTTVTVLPDPPSTSPPATIPAGWGRVTGTILPKPVAAGPAPDLALTFTQDEQAFPATAIDGVYEVDLPPGTWTVTGVCPQAVTVKPGAITTVELVGDWTACAAQSDA